MLRGGNGDRSRLHFSARSDELLNRTEGARSIFPGYGISARNIGIHDRSQCHRLALLRQLMVNAGVITAESTHPYDCYVNAVLVPQVLVLGCSAFFRRAICPAC